MRENDGDRMLLGFAGRDGVSGVESKIGRADDVDGRPRRIDRLDRDGFRFRRLERFTGSDIEAVRRFGSAMAAW